MPVLLLRLRLRDLASILRPSHEAAERAQDRQEASAAEIKRLTDQANEAQRELDAALSSGDAEKIAQAEAAAAQLQGAAEGHRQRSSWVSSVPRRRVTR